VEDPSLQDLSPEDKLLFAKYGKLPKHTDLMKKKKKTTFDSADWMLHKQDSNKQQAVNGRAK
jgi:hypothetical protein